MRIEDRVDPFKLHKLAEDIDRRTFRIMAEDFNKAVAPDALTALKDNIRQEVSTLVAEFVNDLMELKQRLGLEELLSPDQRIPTVAELAQQLPLMYSGPSLAKHSGEDQEAWKRWTLTRLNWIIHSWFQVYGSLTQRLDPTSPVSAVAQPVDTGGANPIEVPQPMQIELAASTWQLVRRMTLEYLQAKANLLQAYGQDVPSVNINWVREANQVWRDAEKAFWSNSLSADILLAHALRDALLQALQLTGPAYPVDMRSLDTCQLPFLAQRAGVPLPFTPQLLGDVAFQLESYHSFCAKPDASLLYPLYRIVGEAVRHLLELPDDPTVPERVRQVLAEVIGADDANQQAQASG